MARQSKSQNKAYENKDFFYAVRDMKRETGLTYESIIRLITNSIVTTSRKQYGADANIIVECDQDRDRFRVFLKKTVVAEVENESTEILLEQAQQINPDVLIGDIVEIDIDTRKFGRINAQSAKNIMKSDTRAAEKNIVVDRLRSEVGRIITTTIEKVDVVDNSVSVKIPGLKKALTLPQIKQIPGEVFVAEGTEVAPSLKAKTVGDTLKIYVEEIKKKKDDKEEVRISRTHKDFVKKLFEEGCPEIADGIVEIVAVARAAGVKTKIAVRSNDSDVDAIGACLGEKSVRVDSVIRELNGEKIEVVLYDEDPVKFVAAALAPANVVSVENIEGEETACKVRVPDEQLSLAIGVKGLNAKLAAQLTGYSKIDIEPESGFYNPVSE